MRALKRFRVDRDNGKVLGVCAGIARLTGWDVTLVRVGMVMLMLIGPFPWTLLPYALVGWLGPRGAAAGAGETSLPRATVRGLAETTDADRRMAEVETCVAGANGPLAREIERLRQA